MIHEIVRLMQENGLDNIRFTMDGAGTVAVTIEKHTWDGKRTIGRAKAWSERAVDVNNKDEAAEIEQKIREMAQCVKEAAE